MTEHFPDAESRRLPRLVFGPLLTCVVCGRGTVTRVPDLPHDVWLNNRGLHHPEGDAPYVVVSLDCTPLHERCAEEWVGSRVADAPVGAYARRRSTAE